MGYFLAFGLIYFGYSLLDWGHYIAKHEKVSLWYLMSGFGTPPEPALGSTNQPSAPTAPTVLGKTINPNQPGPIAKHFSNPDLQKLFNG